MDNQPEINTHPIVISSIHWMDVESNQSHNQNARRQKKKDDQSPNQMEQIISKKIYSLNSKFSKSDRQICLSDTSISQSSTSYETSIQISESNQSSSRLERSGTANAQTKERRELTAIQSKRKQTINLRNNSSTSNDSNRRIQERMGSYYIIKQQQNRVQERRNLEKELDPKIQQLERTITRSLRNACVRKGIDAGINPFRERVDRQGNKPL
ncbi:MAG: hypothetical protein EZS28_031750 [Streblomastix strix]|uniref:Uncharacterized protein n=1 Tax=Streblomastix strix TaxID=222440 RepID=A0A5J4URP7_9EUKA|nr:MAG: hypothetical protein EZS28_031750 [Streblomastix strix]